MLEIAKNGERVLHDFMRGAAFDIGNEANAAGILLERRIKKSSRLVGRCRCARLVHGGCALHAHRLLASFSGAERASMSGRASPARLGACAAPIGRCASKSALRLAAFSPRA